MIVNDNVGVIGTILAIFGVVAIIILLLVPTHKWACRCQQCNQMAQAQMGPSQYEVDLEKQPTTQTGVVYFGIGVVVLMIVALIATQMRKRAISPMSDVVRQRLDELRKRSPVRV